MKKPSTTPQPKESSPGSGDLSPSTDSLEQSGELVDLSSIDLDDAPSSPYGKHLRTIILEVFENATLMREETHGRKAERKEERED